MPCQRLHHIVQRAMCQMDEKLWSYSDIDVPHAPHLGTVVLTLYQQIDSEQICIRFYQHWLQDDKIEIHYQLWIRNWERIFWAWITWFTCSMKQCVSASNGLLQLQNTINVFHSNWFVFVFNFASEEGHSGGKTSCFIVHVYCTIYAQFQILSPIPCLQDVSAS